MEGTVHRQEWFVLGTLTALSVAVCALFSVVSDHAVIPWLTASFGFVPDDLVSALSCNNEIILLLMLLALILLIVPFFGRSNRRIVPNYLSGTGIDDSSYTGHVVSQEMSYSIGVKADRGFKITEGTDTNEQYAKKTVGDTVNLVITPNLGHTLSNVEVKYDGISTTATKSTGNETYKASFKCEGTGIIKVSVSAQIDGSNVTITKTFTVYVVGEIFNTDLDPEVTN